MIFVKINFYLTCYNSIETQIAMKVCLILYLMYLMAFQSIFEVLTCSIFFLLQFAVRLVSGKNLFLNSLMDLRDWQIKTNYQNIGFCAECPLTAICFAIWWLPLCSNPHRCLGSHFERAGNRLPLAAKPYSTSLRPLLITNKTWLSHVNSLPVARHTQI